MFGHPPLPTMDYIDFVVHLAFGLGCQALVLMSLFLWFLNLLEKSRV